ncbi:hypothetical protein QBC46DRAFT_414657 [Diplogelasinospora grovesii]|uniref:Uncharacterized protein n=1 Tax=Diplogelasinospora grovesii TaxID=303347 RepID=A0AAN6MU83_9PEZI|nr:hypothetical protein QBC46DRAFT_414657 [Diplogelasinospora grovesii]
MDPNRCEYRLATTQEDVALYRAELKKMEHVEQRRAAIENELLHSWQDLSASCLRMFLSRCGTPSLDSKADSPPPPGGLSLAMLRLTAGRSYREQHVLPFRFPADIVAHQSSSHITPTPGSTMSISWTSHCDRRPDHNPIGNPYRLDREAGNKYESIAKQYDELHVAYHRDTGIPAGTASAPCEWGTPETSPCVPLGPPHNSTRLPAEGNNSSLSAAASNNNPGWYSPGPATIRDSISGSPVFAPPPPAAQHENWATDSPESDSDSDPFDLEGCLPPLAPPPADNSDPHNNWLAEFETWDLSSDNGAQSC